MIKLSDDLKHRLVNALTDAVAVVVGYVDRNGDPHVSPYGSLHAASDDQLALWVRNPNGEVFYGQLSSRTFAWLRGRAQVVRDEAERTQIFEGMHPFERTGDPD